METMKMGILGSGGIAHTMANTVKEMKDVELYAVGSRTLKNAEKFAEEFGIPKAYGSYEELAADPEVDLVYVATPHSHHYPHVKLLLEHGKHVLCEKPVCSNREELDILIKAAKEQGVVFMEAMKNVHSPGFHAMMDNLHKIGTVRRATIQYCQYSSRYDKFKNGIVENANMAYTIANSILSNIYGSNQIKNEYPLKITLINNRFWVIEGSLSKGETGGTAIIVIKKDDGQVQYINHGK